MRARKNPAVRLTLPLLALALAAFGACSDTTDLSAPLEGDGLRDRPAVPDDWNAGGGAAGDRQLGAASSAGAGGAGGVDGTGGAVPVASGGENAGGEADGGAPIGPPGPCIRLESSEPLRPRSAVVTDHPPASDRTIATRDVFEAFKTSCGTCHTGATQLGGFNGVPITPENFATLIDQSALDRIRENSDVNKVMPQGSDLKLWGQRKAGDPVVQLADLLEKWIAAGRPKNFFTIHAEIDPNTAYLFSEELGESLTNIGNCLPDPRGFGIEHAEMDERDEFFAGTDHLPSRIDETDLISFDSEVLARRGVAAYAPAYPLFTDNAGKLRYVRVPRGESIRFNEDTQDFDIPKNTRFYKTFMMPVTDITGEPRYRKIETRLLVSRPDDCSSGTCKVTALMGTYLWNPDETGAELVTEPQHDTKPFADFKFTFPFDEQIAAQLKAEGGDPSAANRHYATPGRERCVDCHMGSSSKSFILGFSPLQVVRWPYVDEPDMHAPGADLKGFGVLSESAPRGDELTQLERLLSYGVISGLTSADAVKSLKDSQSKPPRNGFELKAQAYMLGNCAHCHNPRGLPSVLNPVLTDMLSFHPLLGGGVFQFPLERTSPRNFRGESGQYAIPYITPSLYDLQCESNGSSEDDPCAKSNDGWFVYQPKWVDDGKGNPRYIKAPWRSLIWRNVDAPFTYSDYYTIYPHMPMNSPGFDCRAPRILGDWMVSIPSNPKTPVKFTNSENPTEREEQPYVEVSTGPSYKTAVARARFRLQEYQSGERYSYCPSTRDIVDPEVESGSAVTPRDHGYFVNNVLWADNVPDRAQWVNTDNTEDPAPWLPRRNTDWKGALVDGKAPEKDADLKSEQVVIDLLRSVDLRLSASFRSWATTDRPFTLWSAPEACKESLKTKRTIATLSDPKPRWTKQSPAKNHPNDPIYDVSPGAAVFFNICINCHGPTGNGHSNLASTIFTLTGGATRVANLADGILGPPGAPGSNRERVFGTVATQLGLGVDDVASRYLVWMALGGTQKQLPAAALLAVANTVIAGERRHGDPTTGSANMLETGHQLCQVALPSKATGAGNATEAPAQFDIGPDPAPDSPRLGGGRDYSKLPLIAANGDAELWESLCAWGQKTPVRVIAVFDGSNPQIGLGQKSLNSAQGTGINNFWDLYDPDAYGNNPVMTPHGVVNGVGNEPYTWCAASAEQLRALVTADKYVELEGIPLCPDPPGADRAQAWKAVMWTPERAEQWALRGAMNAGMAVFAYLDSIAKGAKPALQYNECSKLSP